MEDKIVFTAREAQIIHDIVEEATTKATLNTLKYLKNEEKEKEKRKYDNRLRNTELLLHNYQNFIQHQKNSVYTQKQLSKEELLEELDIDMDKEITDTQINSILKSKNKTAIMLKHIDTFLQYYEYKCSLSSREDIQRRYKVIKYLFLEEDKMTQENVAELLNCNLKTIRNTKNIAVKELSVLFFGIDGIKIR